MTVEADHCFYNRDKQLARSSGSVRIERSNLLVTGKDFQWARANRRFEIHKNAKVLLKQFDAGTSQEPSDEARSASSAE